MKKKQHYGNIPKQIKFLNKYIALDGTMGKQTMILYRKIWKFDLLWKKLWHY